MLNLTLIYRKYKHLRITSLTTFNFSKNFRLLKAGHPFALNYAHIRCSSRPFPEKLYLFFFLPLFN